MSAFASAQDRTPALTREQSRAADALEVLANIAPVDFLVALRQVESARFHSLGRDIEHEAALQHLQQSMASAPATVSPAVARAAQATENAWRSIEAEFGLLSAVEVGDILHAKNGNRAYAAAQRRAGKIMAVERKNALLYPGFQFDRGAGRIRPWVPPLVSLAGERDVSEPAAILWLVSPSNHLLGERPADYAATDGEKILSAAEALWGAEW